MRLLAGSQGLTGNDQHDRRNPPCPHWPNLFPGRPHRHHGPDWKGGPALRVAVKDAEALLTIPLREVAAYLRARGWREAGKIGAAKGLVWTYCLDERGEYELQLPLDPNLRDFTRRMYEVLETLEDVEQRSQVDILQDLATVAGDLIRVRLDRVDVQNGTIPLDVGVVLVESIRDLVAAAASSTVAPKPYYQARRHSQVSEYLQKVRLGQTQQGSFVVTVLSRVPPEVPIGGVALPMAGQSEDPFERRVTTTLASGLQVAHQVAGLDHPYNDMDDLVRQGVSANLCEALASIGRGEAVRQVDVSFHWATVRPAPRQSPRLLTFRSDALAVVGEMGRVLREFAPREDVELVGVVTRLERQTGEDAAEVTVYGSVDGTPRKVRIYLDGPHHQLAIRAYESRTPVVCVGDLFRDGRSFVLRNPRGFALTLDVDP